MTANKTTAEVLGRVREALRGSLGYFALFNDEEDRTKWPRYVSLCEEALAILDTVQAGEPYPVGVDNHDQRVKWHEENDVKPRPEVYADDCCGVPCAVRASVKPGGVCKRCNGSGHVPVEQFIFACPECKEQPEPEIVTMDKEGTDEKGRPTTYWGGLEQPKPEIVTVEEFINVATKVFMGAPAMAYFLLDTYPNGLIVRGEK